MLGFWFMAMIERWVFLQSRPWSVSRAKETVGKFSQSTYGAYIIHKSSSTKHIFPQYRLMQLNLFPYCYKTHVTIGPKDFRDLSLDQQILHNFRVDWELIILSHDPPAQGTDTSLVIHLCWSQDKNALNIPALSLSLFTTLQEACSPWNLWSLPWFLLALQLLVYLTAEGFQAVMRLRVAKWVPELRKCLSNFVLPPVHSLSHVQLSVPDWGVILPFFLSMFLCTSCLDRWLYKGQKFPGMIAKPERSSFYFLSMSKGCLLILWLAAKIGECSCVL